VEKFAALLVFAAGAPGEGGSPIGLESMGMPWPDALPPHQAELLMASDPLGGGAGGSQGQLCLMLSGICVGQWVGGFALADSVPPSKLVFSICLAISLFACRAM